MAAATTVAVAAVAAVAAATAAVVNHGGKKNVISEHPGSKAMEPSIDQAFLQLSCMARSHSLLL